MMTKKAKRRLFKAFLFVRSFCLALCAILFLLGALLADKASMTTTIILIAAAFVSFGVSYFCDYAVRGYKSPFYH